MKRLFNKQFIISVFFFLIFIGVVLANEFNLFRSFTTTEVVMAKEEIPKDTVITEEHIWTYQMPKELVTEEMFLSVDSIVGKTTTQTVRPNQYISTHAVDQSILKPTAEHEFFPIPGEWLVMIQGTLRRYDLVNISAMYLGNSENPSLNNQQIKKDYILESIPVAYVKGSKNEEVTGVTSGEDRLYGSQNPATLQLSLTLEQFKELEQLYLNGYKFVISQ